MASLIDLANPTRFMRFSAALLPWLAAIATLLIVTFFVTSADSGALVIDMITSGVRSSFTYAGASTLADFHERAHVGLQSAAGYEEGKALPVSW